MTRYLDRTGLSLLSKTYSVALDLEYDSDILPESFQLGDVIITGPWSDWGWLPSSVHVEIVPDGTKLERAEPLAHALKQRGLPTSYRKKPPTEKSKNFVAYHEALAQAQARQPVTVGTSPIPFTLVTEPQGLLGVLADERLLAFDYETVSLEDRRIVGLALSDEKSNWYVCQDALRALPEWYSFLNRNQCIAFNAKFEYHVTPLEPTSLKLVHDPMIMNWLLTSQVGGNDLKTLTRKLLKRDALAYDDVVPKGKTLEDVDLDLQARYATADSRNTYDLFQLLKPKLEQDGLWHVYDDIEKPLIPVLVEMEQAGLNIDKVALAEIISVYCTQRAELEKALRYLGFNGNPASGDQVAAWFYDELRLPVPHKTGTGKRGSIDAVALDKISSLHPAIPVYQKWVEVDGWLDFLIPNEGREWLTYSLQQTSTRTGRLSCVNPNMQNWPWDLRRIIVPPEGHLIHTADYSKFQTRIAAAVAQDENLLRIFREGLDPYKELGKALGFTDLDGHSYKIAKTEFLARLFGGGVFKIQEIAKRDGLTIPIKQIREHLPILEASMLGIEAWRQRMLAEIQTTGEARTHEGRRRIVRGVWSKDPTTRAAAEREGINACIQGGEADIIKGVMPEVNRLVKEAGGRLRMQVHDELVYTLGVDLPEVMEVMEQHLFIPLKVTHTVGRNWLEAH